LNDIKKNERGGKKLKNPSFPIADLESTILAKVQELERKLREETGEEIVLIAYQRKETNAK
jgi:hypothetical protein